MTTVVSLVIVVTAVGVGCVSEYAGSLRLVNAVFRHGQRTPADTYPTDPHIKFDFFPYGWGQLTNEGKMQQYQLGQYLKARYRDYLGDYYSSEEVTMQSTDVDRTMMSAQLVAAGLFPPVDYQQWNPHLDWQPIPVHSQPLDQDSLLLVRVSCPRYNEELDSVKQSGERKTYLDSLAPLYQALTSHSGLVVNSPDDVQSLYSTLLAEVQFNLTLPDWTRQFYPEPMAEVTAYSFTLNAYNDELKKLKGGPLLKKILTDCETKSRETKSKRKMFVYAGHDSTVANVMMALKVWEEQIPVYNILSLIELHQLDNVYGLKIYLRNSTEHEPYLLTIPGCQEFCPLETVLELSKGVLPYDLKVECASHNPNYKPPPPSGP